MKVAEIVVATDLRPASRPALAAAIDFGNRFGARVTAVHVTSETPETTRWHAAFFEEDFAVYRELLRKLEEAARKQLLAEVAEAGGTEVQVVVRPGHAARTIVEVAAEKGADLVVVGTTRRKEHLGSVAERVVRTAGRPVLVIPA